MSVLHELGRPALAGLAEALRSGRIQAPFSAGALRGQLPGELAVSVVGELGSLAADGMEPRHIARMLQALAEEKRATQVASDRIELVWSGLETEASPLRDTNVVVMELFREAKESVLVASFAVDRGKKAQGLFGELAERMDALPELSVRFFLNVPRRHHDESADSVILREFAEEFRDEVWPGERLPEVYYDPRSLSMTGKTRASLHAKVIVVDGRKAFITSANFTEAAQERNIEVGVQIDDSSLAGALQAQFDTLVERGELRRVGGCSTLEG